MQGEPRIELYGERATESIIQKSGSPKKARTARAPCLLTSLPTELIFRILGYLDPIELSFASELNRLFYTLALDDELWKALAFHHWADKLHQPLKLHHLLDYVKLSGSLSRAECLDILERRDQLSDNDDMRDKDLEALQRRVRESTPASARGHFWGGKWKSNFVFAELDSKREVLRREELLQHTWRYYDMLTSRGRLETPTIRVPPYVRFYADGTRGPIQDTRPRVVPWTMTSDGEVRVADYPPHTITRTASWGWEISNGWVTYSSADIPSRSRQRF